jgi:DNA-binding NarL/FixJ family response regulator
VETAYASELIGENTAGIGYLLKERIGDVRAFLDALHNVAAGGTVLDRQVVTQLLVPHNGSEQALANLTVREREVLELMAEGRSNAAIAESLVVTPGAIEKHITSIFAKLDLPACDDDHRRVLAVLAYLRVTS